MFGPSFSRSSIILAISLREPCLLSESDCLWRSMSLPPSGCSKYIKSRFLTCFSVSFHRLDCLDTFTPLTHFVLRSSFHILSSSRRPARMLGSSFLFFECQSDFESSSRDG